MGEKLRQKQAISNVKGQADGKITFAVYDCVIHADTCACTCTCTSVTKSEQVIVTILPRSWILTAVVEHELDVGKIIITLERRATFG